MGIEQLETIWPEWRVVALIGEGSFGKVYKVEREEHGFLDDSAVKVISIPQSNEELKSLRADGYDETSLRSYFQGIVTDFVNEIKLMVSMKGSANIVSVADYKVVEKTERIGWDIFIRMELLTPLNDYASSKELTEEDVIKLGQDVCSALELCAGKSIIHRDIKPENIFVSSFGDFKVGDFGIARELEKTGGSMSTKGTLSYMAPEIRTSEGYDATVDTYSLGLVLYKLLNNNRIPFLDPYAQLIQYSDRKNAVDRRLRGEVLPAPVCASPKMAQVILMACSFDPAMRFKTATAFKYALGAIKAEAYASLQTNIEPNALITRSRASGAQQDYSAEINATTVVRKPPGAIEIPDYQVSVNGKRQSASNGKRKSYFIQVVTSICIVGVLAGFMINSTLNSKNGNQSEDNRVTPSAQTASPNLHPPRTTVTQNEEPDLSPDGLSFALNTVGSTAGNTKFINEGRAAIQGDWIYFSNREDYGKLYTINTDGTGKQQLDDIVYAFYINIVGDWIYYSGGFYDERKLYTIRTDGTSRQKLSDDRAENTRVIGDRIYYSNGSDYGKLYTIRTDGTGRQKLSDDRFASDFDVVDDLIYYSNGSDGDKLYTIRTDGTDRQKLSDDRPFFINVSGDWIYYCNADDGRKLYTIHTDGTGRHKLSDDTTWVINVVGDRIYYRYDGSDDYGKLYTIRTDGTDRQKLGDDAVHTTIVLGDRIYYVYDGYDEYGKLYSIRTDGTDRQIAG